jgi:divalent metal cation (Fe/Co/Zn/Cd) transporter
MNRRERESEAIETDKAAWRILLWLSLGALLGLGFVLFALWWIAGKVVGL